MQNTLKILRILRILIDTRMKSAISPCRASKKCSERHPILPMDLIHFLLKSYIILIGLRNNTLKPILALPVVNLAPSAVEQRILQVSQTTLARNL